ncbi:MAG: nitric oxide synthase oxygenase [Verrucomicrobiales bacterium]|nr:nitric oxide synthase oxygenase [Verrucomicrobiales bacterium]
MNNSPQPSEREPNAPRCPLEGSVTNCWDLEEHAKELCPGQQDEHSVEQSARIAWRNSVRCIGRLHWKSLDVIDCRSLDNTDDIYEALLTHLEAATNGGSIRPTMTLFSPWENTGNEIRIWNHQLIRYAGYGNKAGETLGDPMNRELTEIVRSLGWQPPGEPTPFDVLPLLIQCGNELKLYDLPGSAVMEVPLRHPRLSWFEGLRLRWYALPAISDMIFATGSETYSCAPFNGWYMGTEIGARNLGDRHRYDKLPVIAEKMGMDTAKPANLWKDHALVELNEAVLWSFEQEGVRIVDHHTASGEFMRFCKNEETSNRAPSADWSWIVPPVSGSATPVFHRYYPMNPELPNYLLQQAPWKTPRGIRLLNEISR